MAAYRNINSLSIFENVFFILRYKKIKSKMFSSKRYQIGGSGTLEGISQITIIQVFISDKVHCVPNLVVPYATGLTEELSSDITNTS